jgi:hypothetical protein
MYVDLVGRVRAALYSYDGDNENQHAYPAGLGNVSSFLEFCSLEPHGINSSTNIQPHHLKKKRVIMSMIIDHQQKVK